MQAGEYVVRKRDTGDTSSTFLSIKLSALLREALKNSAHNSFIEFTSATAGMIHIGEETRRFTVRKDAKMEIYELCAVDEDAQLPTVSFVGAVSGKAVVQQRSITIEETKLIRQKTEKATLEAKKRKTLSLPDLPSKVTSPSPSVGLSQITTQRDSKKRSREGNSSKDDKMLSTSTSASSSKLIKESKLNHFYIVFRYVPSFFSMNDICHFLSGIKVRSEQSEYFVVYHFNECDDESEELYMDVYVELDSKDGVEIALKRNGENISVSNVYKAEDLRLSRDLMLSSTEYYSAMSKEEEYIATIETVSNSEIFCAVNCGVEVSAIPNSNCSQPSILILKNLISTQSNGGSSLLPFIQLPPSILKPKFPRIITDLEARLKGDHSKNPNQWISYFTDDRVLPLDDNMDYVFSYPTYNDGNVQTINDVRIILADLTNIWSDLLSRRMSFMQKFNLNDKASDNDKIDRGLTTGESVLQSALNFVSRQIRFYQAAVKFECLLR